MKYPKQIIDGVLIEDGETGDGKRAFLVASTNDGWKDLRIEIDTDDVDCAFAELWIARLIEMSKACRGIKDLDALNQGS